MLVTPSKILTYKLVDPTHSKLPLGDLDARSFGEGRRHFNHGEADFKRRSAFGAVIAGDFFFVVLDYTVRGAEPETGPLSDRLGGGGRDEDAVGVGQNAGGRGGRRDHC